MPPRGARTGLRAAPARSAQGQSNIPVRQPAPPNIFPAFPAPQPPQTPPRPNAHPAASMAPELGEEFPGLDEVRGSSDEEDTVVNSASVVPIIISPVKHRNAAVTINRQSDADVWDMLDAEILCEYLS